MLSYEEVAVLFRVPLKFFLCASSFVVCHDSQAKEILSLKVLSWQNKCSDALQVPDTIVSMIEGMRTPISNTPRSSPLMEHFDRVSLCAGFTLEND